MRFTAGTPWYKRLRLLRVEAELTQVEMAERLGTTPRNYWRWENGVNIPIPIYRQKIAETLNVPSRVIFAGDLTRKEQNDDSNR